MSEAECQSASAVLRRAEEMARHALAWLVASRAPTARTSFPTGEVDMRTDDPTPDEFATALRGLDYPAPRSKLLTLAALNHAPARVVSRIMELPETADFINEEELRRTFGITVHGEQPHGWE
jgi:hypothetical protein